MYTQRFGVWLVLTVVACAACGTVEEVDPKSTTTTTPPPIETEWGAFVGTTGDGADVVVAIDDEGGVLVSWSELGCSDDGDEQDRMWNGADPLDAAGSVTADGFTANGQMAYDGLDGDSTGYEVEVVGRPDGEAAWSGTIQLTETSVNGQGEDLYDDYEPAVCESDPVEWSAAADDPTIARTMWAFRETARNDLDRFDELVAAGVAPDARHPIRGTSLSENIDAACVYPLADSYEGLSFDVGDTWSSYPTDGAEDTLDELVERGVPSPACDEDDGG